MPDLIIFDCDGVVADSEVLSAGVLIESLAALGIAITQAEVQRDFLGRSFPTVAGMIRQRFGRPLPDDFEAAYRRELLTRFESDLHPTPGFRPMLETLTLPVCIATSSSPQRVARTLDLLGLTDRFGPHVFTASQVARGKPAPDLFLFAAGRMGVQPTAALVIEDSLPGIEAAQAAGMPVLRYCGGAHLRRSRMPAGPVPHFDNWADLPQFLQASHEGARHREHRTLQP